MFHNAMLPRLPNFGWPRTVVFTLLVLSIVTLFSALAFSQSAAQGPTATPNRKTTDQIMAEQAATATAKALSGTPAVTPREMPRPGTGSGTKTQNPSSPEVSSTGGPSPLLVALALVVALASTFAAVGTATR